MLRCPQAVGKKKYSKNTTLVNFSFLNAYLTSAFALSIHFLVIFEEIRNFLAISSAEALAKSLTLLIPMAFSCGALFSPMPFTCVNSNAYVMAGVSIVAAG